MILETDLLMKNYDLGSSVLTLMRTRSIHRAWMERVLKNPERTENDAENPSLVHAVGRIPERANRELHVVYDRSVDPANVVNVFFDQNVYK